MRETIQALLKAILREKYSHKSEDSLGRMLEEVMNGQIENWQWKKIIEKMYDEEDYKVLEDQIYYRIQLQQ